MLAYGVIGNTAGFGPVVLGSSPSRPTSKIEVPILKSIGIFFAIYLILCELGNSK